MRIKPHYQTDCIFDLFRLTLVPWIIDLSMIFYQMITSPDHDHLVSKFFFDGLFIRRLFSLMSIILSAQMCTSLHRSMFSWLEMSATIISSVLLPSNESSSIAIIYDETVCLNKFEFDEERIFSIPLNYFPVWLNSSVK